MKKLSRILCLLMTCVMMFCMIGGVPVLASEDDPTVPVTEPPLESEQVTAEETDSKYGFTISGLRETESKKPIKSDTVSYFLIV